MIHTEIGLLTPKAQNAVLDTIHDCAESDVFKLHKAVLIVVETVRDLATQMAYYSRSRMAVEDVKAMYKAAGLYAIGDDEAKKAITWTLASNHMSGRACDCAPSLDGNNPWWNAPQELWAEYGRIAKSHGATWGGDWTGGKVDPPHMEI